MTSAIEFARCSPQSSSKKRSSSGLSVVGTAAAEYVATFSHPHNYPMIVTKNPEQIEAMAASGAIQARCLKMLAAKCRPGVTTADLDLAAERFIHSQGATAAFKGYRGFPGSICASPNSMVVHGIPGPYELKRGDIISLDVGVVYEGWVSDAAMTIAVGEVDASTSALQETTLASLHAAVEQVRPGNHLGDVSAAVQSRVEADGLSVIRELVGHGIGREMHEDPQIPNYGTPGRGPELLPGMVLAIEPMVNAGGPGIRMGDDNWSVYSADGSMAAHYEFTVACTEYGPRILTPWNQED